MSTLICSYEGCGRPVHNGGTECIFHAQEKDPQEFRNALAAQIRQWRKEKADVWDFSGWVFVDVDRKPESNRSWEKFNLFRWAVFPVYADFEGATFTGDACFECATFTGDACFERATFSGDTDFSSVTFSWGAEFGSVTFSGDAYFSSATFSGDVNFESAMFSGVADFRNATFSGGAYFSSVTFSGDAYFSSATFSGYAFFVSATFAGDADFGSATFTGDAYFRSATFSGHADFDRATFIESAVFRNANFLASGSFFSVTFEGYADFESATFSYDANFNSATIKKLLNLSYVSFASFGNFSNIIVGGAAKLIWPGVGNKQKRDGRELKPGRLLLDYLEFPNLGNGDRGLLDLRDNVLREDCRLIIKNSDLSRVLFTRTDCRQIEFYNVTKWAELKGRRAVADELFLRTDRSKLTNNYNENEEELVIPTWDEIAITYQQLVVNFRRELDHPVANDFERGLFESRRISALEHNRIGQFWLYNFYKLASNYSGSIRRPFIWLLVLTLLAAAVYGGLLYDVFAGWSTVLDSVVAALRVVSLDRRWFSLAVDGCGVGAWGRFTLTITAVIQTLLTAILITLLIFSVRRRFKHSE